MAVDEKYRGTAIRSELLSSARQRCSGETVRAVTLFSEQYTLRDVAKEVGRSKAVSNNMKVAENLLTGRLVHVQPFALRRTARACRQMLQAEGNGINTRGHLEYLWERACEEANRRGHKLPSVDQR